MKALLKSSFLIMLAPFSIDPTNKNWYGYLNLFSWYLTKKSYPKNCRKNHHSTNNIIFGKLCKFRGFQVNPNGVDQVENVNFLSFLTLSYFFIFQVFLVSFLGLTYSEVATWIDWHPKGFLLLGLISVLVQPLMSGQAAEMMILPWFSHKNVPSVYWPTTSHT